MELAEVTLREVADSDLEVFYQNQADPEGVRMTTIRSRDRQTFSLHWAKIRVDDTVVLRTILCGGRVVGHVASFPMSGRREVGYWIDRAFWGRGVTSKALSEFLQHVEARRPLYAHIAEHNLASQRIVGKCGFVPIGADPEPTVLEGKSVLGLNFELR